MTRNGEAVDSLSLRALAHQVVLDAWEAPAAGFEEWLEGRILEALRTTNAEARSQEREAIAQLCDRADRSTHPADLADLIRARGRVT